MNSIVQLICQGNLHIIKKGKYLTSHVEYLPCTKWYLVKVLNLLQIEYYFFIIRVNKETINKMIISIRNEINKSFFFIISSLLPYKLEASTQQLVFPIYNYTINLCMKQVIN